MPSICFGGELGVQNYPWNGNVSLSGNAALADVGGTDDTLLAV